MSERFYDFAFTAWDMETLGKAAELKGFKYLAIAPERCPETGREHIQGYVYFNNNKTHSAAVKTIEKVFKDKTSVNVEAAKGSAQQNRSYIFGPWDGIDYKTKQPKHKDANPQAIELGELPKRQGERTDLQMIRESIQEGKGMREIISSSTNFQQLKTAEFCFKYLEMKRTWKTRVVYVWGRSGIGKTRYAYDRHPHDEIHLQNCATFKWWQGYDAHPVVVLDECDFKTDYTALKALCDRFPYTVECKGGSRQFLAKTLYITSLSPPEELFRSYPEEGKEMLRRIDEIIYLGIYIEDGEFS